MNAQLSAPLAWPPWKVSALSDALAMLSEIQNTHDVCVSFDPENIITSAGDVLVITVRCRAELPMEAFLKNPMAVVAIADRSPRLYELTTLKRSCAASLARLGSFNIPCGVSWAMMTVQQHT